VFASPFDEFSGFPAYQQCILPCIYEDWFIGSCINLKELQTHVDFTSINNKWLSSSRVVMHHLSSPHTKAPLRIRPICNALKRVDDAIYVNNVRVENFPALANAVVLISSD
jgi:hypothetical protein